MKLTRQGVRDLGSTRRTRTVDVVRQRSPVAIISDGRPRVAVDVCVSDEEIRQLDASGFYVAVVAEDGESDRSWMMRASVAMVDIVCSPDKEVGIMALDCEMIFVRLAGNHKSRVLSKVREAWRTWHAMGCP